MEGLIGQFAERLFRPLSVGFLLVVLAPEVAALTAMQSQRAVVALARQTEQPDVLSAPIEAIGALLLLFLVGHGVGVLGQAAFQIAYWMAERTAWFLNPAVKDTSFFALVSDFKGRQAEFVRERYDYIRFQVDLLCGIAGAGLAALVVTSWMNDASSPALIQLGVFAVAVCAAVFLALHFKYQLGQVTKHEA